MARKPIPLGLMIPLDAALVAGCLLSFAYFHHVRPQVTETDQDLLHYIEQIHQDSDTDSSIPIEEVTGTSPDVTDTDQTETTAFSEEGTGKVTKKTTGSSQSGTDLTDEGHASEASSGHGANTNTSASAQTNKTTRTSKATTTTTTTAPKYDTSGFGAKWPTVFSLGNEIEVTDTTYRSHDVYISISEYSFADSNCHVADIYLRSVNNFKYAFAQDGDPSVYSGGLVTGLQENITSMCSRTNAILAINGDFMGGRQYGYVIRDGYPWRVEPWNDVAALYGDGVVETFSKNEFDVYAAFDRGIRHSFAFGPALVRGGVPGSGWAASHLSGKEPRSGFGYYEPGHYCFMAVDGRGMGGSAGMTADEFAQFASWIGCAEAFNLDGGKTSQLVFNGNVVNNPDGYNGSAGSLRGMSDIFYIGEAN